MDARVQLRTWFLSIATVIFTGAIGWVTTTDGNPAQDGHAMIWLILIVACGLVLAGLYSQAKAEKHRVERDAKQREIARRMAEQDHKLDLLVNLQAKTTRSDLIHKGQKYVRDLKWATEEEISSWMDEWEGYKSLGADGYINNLAKKVMDLPTTPPEEHVNH